MIDTLHIFTDGGSRGNPGPAASAFVVCTPDKKILHQAGRLLGVATNNQAEYDAAIFALTWLVKNYPTTPSVAFFLDSLLVVNQLNGLYRIKDINLKIKYEAIKKLIEKCATSTVKFTYIPRSQNSAADLLVNQTLDG